MMIHRGTIEHLADGQALVSVQAEGCASCGHAHACGMMQKSRTGHFMLPVPKGVHAGDAVWLELPESSAVAYPLLAYLLPALALVTGAALGQLAGSDGGSALGAISGLAAGLLFMRGWRKHLPLPLIRPASPETRSTCNGDSP